MGYQQWNRERGRLIDRQIAGTITDDERRTLAAMNAAMDRYLERYSPRPTDVLEEIEARIAAPLTNGGGGM